MRNFLRKLLEITLKRISQGIIWKFRPGIIGVTGNVGKTSAKTAIAAVVGSERKIRSSPESHNNQYGLPLAIIGEWSEKDLELVSKNQPPRGRILEKTFF